MIIFPHSLHLLQAKIDEKTHQTKLNKISVKLCHKDNERCDRQSLIIAPEQWNVFLENP